MTGTIGIYGTWRALENSPIYRSAMGFGRIAATRGFTVLTGAYSGIMEAAPRGAKEAGGSAIGYAWSKLDAELATNKYLDRVVTFTAIEERMARCVADVDVCVFFPGRTGTAAELALATEMRAKGEKRLPLVLVGDYWEGFFAWLERTNCTLEYPADSSEPATQLYVRIDDATDFDKFLANHEDPRNKQ